MAKVDEHSTDWYLSLILTKVEGMEKVLDKMDKRLDEGDKRFQAQDKRIHELEVITQTQAVAIKELKAAASDLCPTIGKLLMILLTAHYKKIIVFVVTAISGFILWLKGA